MVKALPFIHQQDRVMWKKSDVSAADWEYQTHMENYIFFHKCCYSFSQGLKSLYNTAVWVMKKFIFIYIYLYLF